MIIHDDPAGNTAPRAAPGHSGRSVFARGLREPLLHFVVAGFALFTIYGGLHGGSTEKDPRRIEITADDVRRIQISWLAQWQRPPTADELPRIRPWPPTRTVAMVWAGF